MKVTYGSEQIPWGINKYRTLTICSVPSFPKNESYVASDWFTHLHAEVDGVGKHDTHST